MHVCRQGGMFACMYPYLYIHTHSQICIPMYVYIYNYIYICVCVYIHRYVYIYIIYILDVSIISYVLIFHAAPREHWQWRILRVFHWHIGIFRCLTLPTPALRVAPLCSFFADHLQDDFHIALLLDRLHHQKARVAEVGKKLRNWNLKLESW